ncbi:hypothetical protein A9977_18380 [Variovorax sp. UMC13]|nr:hypothetical protein [Variovorax sp. UMC13]
MDLRSLRETRTSGRSHARMVATMSPVSTPVSTPRQKWFCAVTSWRVDALMPHLRELPQGRT